MLPGTLRRKLGERASALCIFEHCRARSTDPWLERAATKLAFFRSEVYMPVAPGETTEERIATAIRYAENLPAFWGICSAWHGPKGFWTPHRITLDLPTMKDLAACAYCIVVGAYDGEGYVIWRAGDGSHDAG